jgi:hypothetical protein
LGYVLHQGVSAKGGCRMTHNALVLRW